MNDEIPSNDSNRPFRVCAADRQRVRLHISYDGTDFHGWQRQVDEHGNQTQVTGQGTIEAAVERLFGEKLSVVGASRTDAGVHAKMQVAHFDALRDPAGFRDLRWSLQCLTPASFVIKDVFLAPKDFHAIACAQSKTYHYSILNRRVPSALRHRTTWWQRQPLDLDLLNEASQFLVGTQDFKSFQTSGTEVETTVRTVTAALWRRSQEGDTLEFEIQGEGFLKQMVRNIVGTMVDLVTEGRPPSEMKAILVACDRRRAGNTAPAHGLFLTSIRYPPELDNQCHRL